MTKPFSTTQQYDNYDAQDYRVWRLLTSRQLKALKAVACAEYLECVDQLFPVISADHPPRFSDLNRLLQEAHGWSIKVVPGFLPVDEFFGLLARRRFCSSTWLRSEEQLDYLEEPDMFHDIFGHIPLYMNKEYADFAEQLGKLGVAVADNEERITQLQRLYWFTIEFGVIRQEADVKIYGAGICSSYGETRHIFDDPKVEVLPFDIDAVIAQDFVISEVQMKYFAIRDFSELYASVTELARRWGIEEL